MNVYVHKVSNRVFCFQRLNAKDGQWSSTPCFEFVLAVPLFSVWLDQQFASRNSLHTEHVGQDDTCPPARRGEPSTRHAMEHCPSEIDSYKPF